MSTSRHSGLTIRQEKFCRLLVELGGSTNEAERQAGIPSGGGSALISNNPNVFFYIQELRAHLDTRHEDLRDQVIDELKVIAFSNVSDYLTYDGNTLIITAMEDLPRHLLGAVSEVTAIDTASGPSLRIRFYDKVGALDRLAKIGGYYQDKRSVNITQTYVLRAPEVAKSSQKWLEMQAENAKLIETQE